MLFLRRCIEEVTKGTVDEDHIVEKLKLLIDPAVLPSINSLEEIKRLPLPADRSRCCMSKHNFIRKTKAYRPKYYANETVKFMGNLNKPEDGGN